VIAITEEKGPLAYQAIADYVRGLISDGTLAPGARVPAQTELARRFEVAGATVARAMAVLQREGLIASVPGSGAFVRERSTVLRLVRSWYRQPGEGSPWRAAMEAIGREGSWESHSTVEKAGAVIGVRLAIDPDADVMRTDYLYLLDGEPAFLATSWEALELTAGTPVMMPEAGPYAGAGVRDRMAAIGHTPTRCVEEPMAHLLSGSEAHQLRLGEGTKATLTERTYFEGDRPLETADIILPPHIRAVYELPVD
jgi:DNA-binding GntR family transcriptional regulator